MTATLIESEVGFGADVVFAPIATFDEVLTRYQTELYQYASQLTRKRSDADDLYRETLLEAFRGFDRLDGATNHRTWLYRIATNAFLSSRRRSERVEPLDEATEPEDQADHAARLDDRNLLSEVAAFMDQLPAKQRVALVLRKYHGLGYDEIAANLDTSEGAARSGVHQALRDLRERFDGRL
jgi:RNA polymerase sigma-70 factor (ECF subfamily)